jgi:hypothetical protein
MRLTRPGNQILSGSVVVLIRPKTSNPSGAARRESDGAGDNDRGFLIADFGVTTKPKTGIFLFFSATIASGLIKNPVSSGSYILE